VDFDATSTSGTLSVTATNGCGTSAPRSIAVTVHPLPVPTISGSDTICQGTTLVYSTEAGMSNYSWTVSDFGPTAAHTIIAGGGATDNTIIIRWDGYEDHRVSVNYEEDGCTAASPTELDIWVSKPPEPGPAYHIPNDNVP